MKLSAGAKRALTVLLIAAAVVYLGLTVARNREAIRGFDWDVDPLLLAASVVAHVLVLAWGVWVWGRVLERFEHPPVRLPTLLRIWFLSNLARYIPGKIFQFVAVAQLSRAAGLSGAVLLTSIVVHTALALLSAALISAWTLAGPLFPALPPVAVGAAATAAAVLLVHPRFLGWALGLLRRLTKRDVIRWNGGWGDGVLLLGLSVLSWALYGGAYWLMVASLTDVPGRALLMLTGVNALSFVFGYLAIVTPGGAGVREFAMTQLLLPILPVGVAAVIAIVSRLLNIAAELIGGGFVLLAFRPSRAAGPAPADAPPTA
jgi:uncharacterized membrane protein YbhN (UPF0104 family)